MHVAVLGLGAMGSRMAQRVSAAGHRVTVWNRTTSVAAELAGRRPERSVSSRALGRPWSTPTS